MPIAVFGLNHNTAPIEVRERLFVSEETIPRLVRELQESGVDENIVLSTCNRTELYISSSKADNINPTEILCEQAGLKDTGDISLFNIKYDEEAIS